MTSEKFIPNKTALITLIAASLVVIISLGIRQTFGLFFFDFEIDLGCSQTEFGFAMGIQSVSYTHLTLPTNREV